MAICKGALRSAVGTGVVLALGTQPAEAETLKGTSSFGLDVGAAWMEGRDAWRKDGSAMGFALTYQKNAHRVVLGHESNLDDLNDSRGGGVRGLATFKYGFAPVQWFGHFTPVLEVGYATGGYVPMCYDKTTAGGMAYAACGVSTPKGGLASDLLLDTDVALSRNFSMTIAVGAGVGMAAHHNAVPQYYSLLRGGFRSWK